MTLWLLTGGNLLFGDWGRPKQSAEQKVSESALEKLASECESGEPGDTNNQLAFAQLIRDGHYLGYWSSKDEVLPKEAMTKVGKAIDYKHLYPRWLFLRDFPPSQFDNLERRGGRPAFSKSAKDFIEPKFHEKSLENIMQILKNSFKIHVGFESERIEPSFVHQNHQ